MALCEKILIAGFSGSGKTSLLHHLEKIAPPEWTLFSDLDQLILKNRAKGEKSLARLIESKGWETFRLWERQELESWLKEEEKGVLALGGGTLSPMVWNLFSKSRKIKFCYLHSSFETCWERLIIDNEERPLVKKGQEALFEIYQEREKVFQRIPWQLQNEKNTDIKVLARSFWDEIET